MPRPRPQRLLLGAALCLAPLGGAVAVDAPPTVDRLVRAMTDALAAANALTAQVEKSFDDVLATGEKLRCAGAVDIAMRPPDGFHVSCGDALGAKKVWHDGAPLPPRPVVTHADRPREPQTTFELKDWNLSADLPVEVFVAAIPPGEARATFLPSGRA